MSRIGVLAGKSKDELLLLQSSTEGPLLFENSGTRVLQMTDCIEDVFSVGDLWEPVFSVSLDNLVGKPPAAFMIDS